MSRPPDAAPLTGSAARALRDALEPVAAHAFWSTANREAMADLGLDATAAYVRGRAAVLGAATAPAVISTFAWFEPGLIESAYRAGPADLTPVQIDRTRSAATGASLRTVRPAVDPDWLADVLTAATGAGGSFGRPLFTARRTRTPPTDGFERLWWAAETLRDHRGDSHTAAAVVAGVGPVEMNILTELALGGAVGVYTVTRGWNPAAIGTAVQALQERGWLADGNLTAEGHQARQSIELRTDVLDEPVLARIGSDLPAVLAALDGWAVACIEAGAFPQDRFKRLAG